MFIELVVRVFIPHTEIAEWYQSHPKYNHILKPNFYQLFHYPNHDAVMTVQTNSLGFRELQLLGNGKTAGFKVLFLGDSFVFGYGLEVNNRLDSFLHDLAKERNIPLTTVNWGVPGWGTSHQVLYAEDHLQEESPDVLVLLFCKNDPANDRGLELPTLTNIDSPLYFVKYCLRRYSHLYRWLLEFCARSRQLVNREGIDTEHAYNISSEEWNHTTSYILQLSKIFEDINPEGCILLLAAAPEDIQVKKNLVQIAEKISQLFYIDLIPYVEDIPYKERVMAWDGHWSPAVHNAAAKAVMDWIDENMQQRLFRQ